MCPAQPRAQHKRVSRARLHVANAARDHASGEGIRSDGDCDRISHLGPSGSVVAERAAAVEAAISVTNSRHKFRSGWGCYTDRYGLYNVVVATACSVFMPVTRTRC